MSPMNEHHALDRLGATLGQTYLGDGVYAGVDVASQIWLLANRDGTPHYIALDQRLIDRLAELYDRIPKLVEEATNAGRSEG